MSIPVECPTLNPLIGQPIPDCYVVPGARLLGGEYPIARDPVEARVKLARIVNAGVDVFVDLTTSDDPLEPYEELIAEVAGGREVRCLRHPIPDMDVTDPATMTRILDAIDDALLGGRTVYVHCWGGVGRTGTVIGCWLARHGMDGDAALRRVGELFATVSEQKRRDHPTGSPQTSAQREMVRRWREPRFGTAQVRGCLLGGAVGDALGAAVEFLSWPGIRQRFGACGIEEPAPAYGRVGAITDDTQMTLFTAEGVLRGVARWNERGIGGPVSTMPHAYLRWLYTQDCKLPPHLDEPARAMILGDHETPGGWLVGLRALHVQRAPGHTCLAALRQPRLGTREAPLNDSKGCGGVMRVAPVALVPNASAEECFQLACDAAALTHGHPTGWLTAGALAWILVGLRDRLPLEQAVLDAIERLGAEPGHEETSAALRSAIDLWQSAALLPNAAAVESLGAGWTAEEALGIAVYCALVAGDDLARGVRLAVNHSGDSDSTGSITGQIIGARLGEGAIPQRWLDQLELRDEITAIANDLVVGWREGEEWRRRYPGC